MEISGTMAAADLLQFLATTVKSELLSRVLASSRDVEGMAMPVFRLVGPPTAVTFAGGEIKAQHVNLTNAFLPERLTALQGRFVLAEGETQFDQVTAHLGDLTVQVQGGITGGSGSGFRDLAVRVSGDAAHMTELLPTKALPQGAIEGLASAIVVVTGATSTPHLRGEVGLTESRVTIPNVLEKPIGAPVTIAFEGDILQAKTVTLSRVELSAPPLRLPIKGKLQLGDKFLIDAALATGTVSLSAVPEWIAKGGFEAGNLELSLDIKGKDRDWRTWKTTGWLALSNGLMTVKGTGGPIQDLYVRLLLARDTAELKRLSFRLMPDGHWGYGFPIGGVAAFDVREGIISPGGVGYDVNCGMRLIRTDLTLADVTPRLERLMDELFRRVPAGVGAGGSVKLSRGDLNAVMVQGARWCVEEGYGWHRDLDRIEEGGCIREADPSTVSDQAVRRGINQLGTLGSGNHYLEVQVASNDRIFDPATAAALGITGQDQIVVMVLGTTVPRWNCLIIFGLSVK